MGRECSSISQEPDKDFQPQKIDTVTKISILKSLDKTNIKST